MKKNNIRIRQFFTGIFIVGMSFLICSCAPKEPKKDVQVARPVKTMVLSEGLKGSKGTYPAKTEAFKSADLAFQISGQIVELPVKRGNALKKGDLIGSLDASDYNNAYRRENAKFIEAQSDLDRYRKLYEDGVIPIADLKVKEKKFSVTRADMEIAKKALDDASLLAPFDGVVSRKYVDNFQNVKAKEPIIKLQDATKLYVVINIPESDLISPPQDKLAINAFATIEGTHERKFELKIGEWETEADPVTQTFLVKFIMPAPEDIRILPGMTATVTISGEFPKEKIASQFVVSSVAVFADDAGGQFVWVVNAVDMTVSKRAVKIGAPTGAGNVHVLSGLKSGERVAITGASQLYEGMKIRLMED